MKRENTHACKRSFPSPALASNTGFSPHAHTYTYRHIHPSVLMRRASGSDQKQRELVRDGTGAQNGITAGEEEGGGWGWGGMRQGTDVWTKGLAKLSGLQPRVFTTLVSITNKSRISPSLPSPPPPPPQLKLPLLPLFFPLSNSALLGTAN